MYGEPTENVEKLVKNNPVTGLRRSSSCLVTTALDFTVTKILVAYISWVKSCLKAEFNAFHPFKLSEAFP